MFGSEANKPSAMETMVAKMIGFTPDQMQQTITNFRDTILAVAEALKRIEEKQGAILDKMEALENVGSKRDHNASRGKPGRSPANSDVGQRDGTANNGVNEPDGKAARTIVNTGND